MHGKDEETGERQPDAPPIRYETACAEFGNAALVRATLEAFLRDAGSRVARMGRAFESGEPDAVWRDAHLLRGAAATLEAAPLSEAARLLEKDCRDGRAGAAALDRVRRELAALAAFFEAHRAEWMAVR